LEQVYDICVKCTSLEARTHEWQQLGTMVDRVQLKPLNKGKPVQTHANPNAPDTFGYADQVLSRLVPTAQADSLDNWWENLERVDEPADTGNWWEQLESVDAMTPEQQEPDNRSLMGDVGRQLGLTARYGLEGLADAAGI